MARVPVEPRRCSSLTALDRKHDASSQSQNIQQVILPMFCGYRDQFIDVRCNAIAINGSFFNTQSIPRDERD